MRARAGPFRPGTRPVEREKGGLPIEKKRTARRKAWANRKENVWLMVLAALAVISVAAAVMVLTRPKTGAPPAQEPAEKLTDSIDLPMYAELSLKVGVTEQNIAFRNPARNFCYIQPSLWLADGTLLWRGLLIAPGDVGNPVSLSQPLPEGTYEGARLHYDCFTMNEEKTQLNGGECILALIVQ